MLLQEILQEDNCGNFINLFAHFSFLTNSSEMSPIILKNSQFSVFCVFSEPVFESYPAISSLKPPVKYSSLIFQLILSLEVVFFLFP